MVRVDQHGGRFRRLVLYQEILGDGYACKGACRRLRGGRQGVEGHAGTDAGFQLYQRRAKLETLLKIMLHVESSI